VSPNVVGRRGKVLTHIQKTGSRERPVAENNHRQTERKEKKKKGTASRKGGKGRTHLMSCIKKGELSRDEDHYLRNRSIQGGRKVWATDYAGGSWRGLKIKSRTRSTCEKTAGPVNRQNNERKDWPGLVGWKNGRGKLKKKGEDR